MRDLRVCEDCGGWREKWRSCEYCGFSDIPEAKPKPPPEPEGNSRSLQRMLKYKGRR